MSSDLRRIAEALVADLDRLQGDRGELEHWRVKLGQWAMTVEHHVQNPAYIEQRPELEHVVAALRIAESKCTAAIEPIALARKGGHDWYEQMIGDRSAGAPLGERGSPPDPSAGAIPDDSPAAPKPASARKRSKAERKRLGRVFADFPYNASDDEKSAWYHEHADDPRVPDWFRPIMRGKAFHHGLASHFTAVEVTIHLDLTKLGPQEKARLRGKDKGKSVRMFRVDALRQGQIISLKYAQLADLAESTWKGYIDEMVKKYNPGRRSLTIGDTATNRTKVPRLVGKRLQGQMILGVSPQSQPIPRKILDYADDQGVVIKPFTLPKTMEDPR